MGESSVTDKAAELFVPSRCSFGFALAKDLKRLLDSRFRAAGAGAGVDSLLGGAPALAAAALSLGFSLPLPKKSLAVED